MTQRLDIQFDGAQELQSTLDDISSGGLGITVPDPLQLGQSVQTVISTLDESCSLKLRARVVRQEPYSPPMEDQGNMIITLAGGNIPAISAYAGELIDQDIRLASHLTDWLFYARPNSAEVQQLVFDG